LDVVCGCPTWAWTNKARFSRLKNDMRSSSPFSRFATGTARAAGHPLTFCAALLVVLVWALSGPFFGFSDTWQLVINTSTTIITNLIVFLIQNTQNRDSAALQLKLDELIRSTKGAHNALLDLEELDEGDLDRIRGHYEELARRARSGASGVLATGSPDLIVELEAPKR
jgi:low affinity Fe/Cu permease